MAINASMSQGTCIFPASVAGALNSLTGCMIYLSFSYIPLYVYTHVNVLQILLKNINSAWLWGCRELHVQTRNSFQTRVSVLEHQRTDCD